MKQSQHSFFSDLKTEFFGVGGMSNNRQAAVIAASLKVFMIVGIIALVVLLNRKDPDYSNTTAVEYFRAETGADDGTGASRLVTH